MRFRIAASECSDRDALYSAYALFLRVFYNLIYNNISSVVPCFARTGRNCNHVESTPNSNQLHTAVHTYRFVYNVSVKGIFNLCNSHEMKSVEAFTHGLK